MRLQIYDAENKRGYRVLEFHETGEYMWTKFICYDSKEQNSVLNSYYKAV
jgi:hypothetical protein